MHQEEIVMGQPHEMQKIQAYVEQCRQLVCRCLLILLSFCWIFTCCAFMHNTRGPKQQTVIFCNVFLFFGCRHRRRRCCLFLLLLSFTSIQSCRFDRLKCKYNKRKNQQHGYKSCVGVMFWLCYEFVRFIYIAWTVVCVWLDWIVIIKKKVL